MKKSVLVGLVMLSTCLAQESDFTTIMNVGAGYPNFPEFTLIQIPEIYSAVIFSWPRIIAGCPATHNGDFLLKKTSASPGHLIAIPACPIVGQDSATFNTSSIYEIPTFYGTTYYMSVIEASREKVKVRITKEKPSTILPKVGHHAKESSAKYLANGQSILSPSAQQKVLPR
jgi:hypothetical protein